MCMLLPLRVTLAESFPARLLTSHMYCPPSAAPLTLMVKFEVFPTVTLSNVLIQENMFPGPPLAEQVNTRVSPSKLFEELDVAVTLLSGDTML